MPRPTGGSRRYVQVAHRRGVGQFLCGPGTQQPDVPTADSCAGEAIDVVFFPEGYVSASDQRIVGSPNPGRVRRWRGARRPVSTPCPPNRTCGSPASGSPVGSCNSHTERQFGAASSHRRSPAVPVALRAPGSEAARLHRGAPLRRAARPVHALTAPSLPSVSPAPSLTHVMLRNSLPLHAGFIGKATPAGLRPSVIPPHLRPLSSTGITPRLQSYGPLRHPAGPACPSRGSGCRVHGTDGASRVATHSIFHTCRRHYPGGNQPVVPSLSSRPIGGLPLSCGGSAPAFDVSRPAQRSLHVPARVVAKPPDDLAPPLAVSAVSSFVPV